MKSLRQIIREVNDNPDPKDIERAIEKAKESLVAAKRKGMKGEKNKTEIEFYERKLKTLTKEETGYTPPESAYVQQVKDTRKKDDIADLIKNPTKFNTYGITGQLVKSSEPSKPSSNTDDTNPNAKNLSFDRFFTATMSHEDPSRTGKVTHDTGGKTKYGISSNAHPDVDVENLTIDQAKRIYQKHYYDPSMKITKDTLSPASQLVAADTAVNMGHSTMKKVIAQGGDNPKELIAARSKEYNRLATENPKKYGSSLKGWENRLEKLRNQAAELPHRKKTQEGPF